MKLNNLLKIASVLIVLAIIVMPAFAHLGLPPSRITGEVYTIDGDNVELIENGHEITIGDVIEDIVDGYYSIDVEMPDSGSPVTVDFYVDSTKVLTRQIEGSQTIDIYLNEDLEPIGCTESWSCGAWSDWSVCEENSQFRTRTCTDANACGTIANKPSTTSTQSCGTGGGDGGGGGGGGTTGKTTVWIDESSDADEDADTSEDESSDADAVIDTSVGGGSSITGGFIGRLTEPSVIATALATVVIVLGIFFHFRRK